MMIMAVAQDQEEDQEEDQEADDLPPANVRESTPESPWPGWCRAWRLGWIFWLWRWRRPPCPSRCLSYLSANSQDQQEKEE